MKRKEFADETKNIPNSNTIKKKEGCGTVRISHETLAILKLNAVLSHKTMKDYLENLILEDNANKQ